MPERKEKKKHFNDYFYSMTFKNEHRLESYNHKVHRFVCFCSFHVRKSLMVFSFYSFRIEEQQYK